MHFSIHAMQHMKQTSLETNDKSLGGGRMNSWTNTYYILNLNDYQNNHDYE